MFNTITPKTKAILLLIIMLAITNITMFASNFIEIKGTILDTNSKPIPCIFVSVEGITSIVLSDINGNFILRLPANTKFPVKLSFYSINHYSQTTSITKSGASKLQQIKLKEKVGHKDYDNQKRAEEERRLKEREDAERKYMAERGERRKIERIELQKENKEKLKKYIEGRNKSGDSVMVEEVDGEIVNIKIKLKGEDKWKDDVMAMKAYMPREIEVEIIGSDIARTTLHSMVDGDLRGMKNDVMMGLPPPNQPDAAAGLLTAGELNDFTKWNLWEDIKSTDLNDHIETWRMFPNERYVAQLTNPNGNAIINAKVTLKDNQGNNLWQTYTDNTGKAELWAKIMNDSVTNTGKPYHIVFEYQKQTKSMEAAPFHIKINTMEMNVICNEINAVDIDFIVDATGSMGDEIRYLQEELYDVIQKLQAQNPHIDLRTASIFYRDFGDAYLIRRSEFTEDINTTLEFMKEQRAGGGGDYPEAVDIALYESIENRNWRVNTLSKIIFLILDAPPHALDSCIKQMQRQIRIAAMKGIRIVPLVCSGADKNTEYLMRAIALATNGTYVFLTDESGIGDPHIKPTTDKYEVEKLNHILLRVISQFSTKPNCNNDWDDFDSTLTSFDKFISKPYKELPEEDTERIEDISNLIKVYPMPCDGILNVETLYPVSHLYVADITGKVLQNFELIDAARLTINLHGYSNGVYFINAFYQGRWYSVKFLLNK